MRTMDMGNSLASREGVGYVVEPPVLARHVGPGTSVPAARQADAAVHPGRLAPRSTRRRLPAGSSWAMRTMDRAGSAPEDCGQTVILARPRWRGKPEVRTMPTRLPQPELSSLRLRLREPREDDAPALFAIHGDPQVMRYWSCPAWTRPAQAEQKLADIRRQRRELDILVWAIADARSDLLIGTSAVFAMNL
ncbi:N-acetyltransferase [Stenotrophomonas acidaminiphila]|nr:N-acetyltransferase [Stenotrophomonas acidaminiphila]